MKKLTLYLFLLTMISACKERYELPYSGPATGYLVIDGVINSGQGPTTLRLTRTLALVDSVGFRNETGANVRVEGEDNSSQQIIEIGNGVYRANQLTFNPNIKYRLHINSSNGKEYMSDYVAVLKTPPIDGINWERPADGVMIFIDTHDPLGNTQYYRWEYEESWEFHSAFMTSLKYKLRPNGVPYDVEGRDPVETQQMYTCYSGGLSTNLLIGSSAKLSRDTIHLPLLFVPDGSWKLSVLYSLLVRQYAVSKAGYEFLQRMKKNTEQVGSLFDAQPSELRGNVQCLTDPNELVIGFVDIAEAQEKRIFISRADVHPWNYRQACYEEDILNNPDTLEYWSTFIPTSVSLYSQRGDTLRVFAGSAECVDCRTRGTHIKPSYWP